ncbi:MAG: hypothetical protein ACOX81_02185 [Candidatus Heteroscillospira sp.]|jgi:hypothetical protein
MRYYAQYFDNKLIAIGTGNGGTEITEAEYKALLAEIREKAALVDKLYSGEITIDAVPAEWREEIRRRADERREQDASMQDEEISGDELLAMMEEVL